MLNDTTNQRTETTAAGGSMLLTPKQAAATLAISARKLWSLTNCGDIPSVRIGRLVRYDPADLRAWIEQQKVAVRAR